MECSLTVGCGANHLSLLTPAPFWKPSLHNLLFPHGLTLRGVKPRFSADGYGLFKMKWIGCNFVTVSRANDKRGHTNTWRIGGLDLIPAIYIHVTALVCYWKVERAGLQITSDWMSCLLFGKFRVQISVEIVVILRVSSAFLSPLNQILGYGLRQNPKFPRKCFQPYHFLLVFIRL